MNRAEFQRLANERILDAKVLLTAKRWACAYYVAGYAVECGLKACLLARIEGAVEVVFTDRKFSEKCWTHNLAQLIELAGLSAVFASDLKANPELQDHWTITKNWNESRRYRRTTKIEAKALYKAIADKNHGILPWIKARW